mmetsp:Transcript_82361/g.207231  ORF Transcript_82361/g.207231 Transcript_82361/m.207231 type:complete len:239 (+) Transcript_82361:81-797(+)
MAGSVRRSSCAMTALMAAAFTTALFCTASRAFLPATPPRPLERAGGAAATAAGLGAAGLGAAAPAFAEEGLLNFGKVKLGGGFALNLDIPETGVVNIVVLIGGLIYLLGPLLSESMATREKEIQTDIDDAIAKYNEATARLAEAQKAKAQADEVIAEITASIEKDQKEFEETIQVQTSATLAKQAAAAELALKELEANADSQVETYVQQQAVRRGMRELANLSDAQKAKFMDAAIASL